MKLQNAMPREQRAQFEAVKTPTLISLITSQASRVFGKPGRSPWAQSANPYPMSPAGPSSCIRDIPRGTSAVYSTDLLISPAEHDGLGCRIHRLFEGTPVNMQCNPQLLEFLIVSPTDLYIHSGAACPNHLLLVA